jgi:hypothetical protein
MIATIAMLAIISLDIGRVGWAASFYKSHAMLTKEPHFTFSTVPQSWLTGGIAPYRDRTSVVPSPR